MQSALRELKEELGVTVKEEDLINCGQVQKQVDTEFGGVPYHDRQISCVFLLWLDQEEEVDSVRWMDYAKCRGMVAADTLPNCIIMEELNMLEGHFA